MVQMLFLVLLTLLLLKGKDFSELDVDYIEIEAGKNAQTNLTFTTGGFGSSSWTFGVNRSEVDPMFYSDLDGFDSFMDDPDQESILSPRLGMYMRTGATYDQNAPDGGSQAYGAPFYIVLQILAFHVVRFQVVFLIIPTQKNLMSQTIIS